jgi:hypothetical protein
LGRGRPSPCQVSAKAHPGTVLPKRLIRAFLQSARIRGATARARCANVGGSVGAALHGKRVYRPTRLLLAQGSSERLERWPTPRTGRPGRIRDSLQYSSKLASVAASTSASRGCTLFQKLRRKLTYANVISTLCMFLLLGGGAALASSKLKANSVGTKQIKNNAVNGSKVADGSLSGADIGGSVNSANHAGNSDQLGGSPSSAFFPSSSAQRIDWNPSGCGSPCQTDLLSMDGFTIQGNCAGAAGGDLHFTVTTVPSGTVDISATGERSAGGTFLSDGNSVGFQPVQFTSLSSLTYGNGTMTLRSASHTIGVVFHNRVTDAAGVATCAVFGTAYGV